MKVVLMRKEYEHGSQEPPGSTGKLSESCMGVFPSMKAVQREVAVYLFDELSYYASVNNNHVIVEGAVSWKTQRDDCVSVCEVSIANTDYVFTCYFLDDDDEDEGGKQNENHQERH